MPPASRPAARSPSPGWPWCLPVLALALLVRLYWLWAPFTYDPITIVGEMRAMTHGGFTELMATVTDRIYLPLGNYLLLIPGWFSLGPAPGDAVTPVEMLALRLSLIFTGVVAVATIYRMGRRAAGPRVALAAALVLALWPGSIYVDSWWTQTDIWYVVPMLLAGWWLARRRLGLAWLALALAVAIKWQAALVLPVFAVGTWRWFGWRGLVKGGLVAAGAGVLLAAPVLAGGQIREYLSRTLVQTLAPYVVEGAHNFWFAVAPGVRAMTGKQALETSNWFGGVTYRSASLVLVALVQVVIAARLAWRSGPRAIAAAAALAVLGTTMFATQISTRHYMAAPALLLLASLFDRKYWLLCLGLMATQIINLLWESGQFSPLFPAVQIPLGLAVWNAWANLAILAFTLAVFLLPLLGPAQQQAAREGPLQGAR